MPRRRRNRVPRRQTLKERVQRAYVTPGHAVAFSTPNRVSKFFGITPGKAKSYLEELEGYTLHREYKQPKVYNPYFVHKRREQVQGDLIDISQLAADNDGVKFLLVLIDIFTKKLWVYALKSKSGLATKTALQSWIESLDTTPDQLVTDRGREFENRQVQNLLRAHNIVWNMAYGTLKACIAERVNKSLQILIFKYMTENESRRYIDQLPNLIRTYNTRGHRTLEGMSPADADLVNNEEEVMRIFHDRYAKAGEHRTKNFKFRVGDTVRLKTMHKSKIGGRAYDQQFKGEYFRVTRINRTLPIALYYIQSLNTGEHILGGLYANELVRQRGDVYKVEEVLDERRNRRNQRELLIKFKHFDEPEWTLAANVTRQFRQPRP